MGTAAGTILVVEDDVDSRLLLSTLLTLERYQVVTACDGVEGLIQARRHHPRLILLDLMMPRMDGEEFRERQLADPDICQIPVILVTAHVNGKRMSEDLRAICCIAKPIDVDEVMRQVLAACPTARIES